MESVGVLELAVLVCVVGGLLFFAFGKSEIQNLIK
jgi:hypothetical protein